MIFDIILAAVGLYSIFNGVKIIITGKLTAREEDRLKDYSKKGARTYKLVYSIVEIISGLLIIGLGVINILEAQNIMEETLLYRIILIGVILVLVGVLLFAKSKCKKMTDDE